jgi:hypothetical protein
MAEACQRCRDSLPWPPTASAAGVVVISAGVERFQMSVRRMSHTCGTIHPEPYLCACDFLRRLLHAEAFSFAPKPNPPSTRTLSDAPSPMACFDESDATDRSAALPTARTVCLTAFTTRGSTPCFTLLSSSQVSASSPRPLGPLFDSEKPDSNTRYVEESTRRFRPAWTRPSSTMRRTPCSCARPS